MQAAGVSRRSPADDALIERGFRRSEGLRAALLTAALVLRPPFPCAAFAAEPASLDEPSPAAALENDAAAGDGATSRLAQAGAPAARTSDAPKPDVSAEIEARKSYSIPAWEIVGFDFLLNRYNRYFSDIRGDYDVSGSSIRNNLRSGWGTDKDPFKTNQLGHPYQGSMYQ